MLFLIKYEFWQNYLKGCKRRGIPVYSVSSIFRPNQIFFRWYGRLGYAKVLNKVTHFFVQNEQSRELLASIGHKENVTVIGDTRFDRVIDISIAARELPLIEKFSQGHKVFVAGSSWPPDEALFIPWFINNLQKQEPLVDRLVIAPHVISERHLADIEHALRGRRIIRYSAATDENVLDAEVLIIDCFGLLSSIYRYARVAMVGGGFGVGIHNVAEAAVYGVPVIIGPNNKNFREARHLLDVGACFEVHDSADFCAIADNLFSNQAACNKAGQAAAQYIHGNAGATDIVYRHVFES